MITAMAGNKVIAEKLLETKNKYRIKKRKERTNTVLLKTAIIEKECNKSLKKFIFEGPKYLFPLIEGIDILSLIIFVTDPVKLLQMQASLASLIAWAFGKKL